MRRIYINSVLIDIDEQTSIGIDFQAYDIKEPSKRKVNTSNSFSIPKTAHNLALFGHPDNPQSTDNTIYSLMTCDYWIDNYQLIKNANVRVEEINDRINLYVANKRTLWDTLKDVKWSVFVADYLQYLISEKGFPDVTNYDTETDFETFLTPYTTSTTEIKLPFYYGNALNYEDILTSTYLEDPDKIVLRYLNGTITPQARVKGGHFVVYFKSIFEYIEWKYSVSFLTNTASIDGNIWDDTIAPTLYTPIRDLNVGIKFDGSDNIIGYYFKVEESYCKFSPLDDTQDKEEKTLFDCIDTFIKHLNLIVEDLSITGTDAIFLGRFDDIKTLAPVIDFSNLAKVISFKTSLPGYNQNNLIKFKSIYEQGASDVNSRNIQISNLNLDYGGDLFTIDAHIPAFKEITNGVIPDLSTVESFKTFEVLIDDDVSDDDIEILLYDLNPATSSEVGIGCFIPLNKSALYDLTGEYLFVEEIIDKPKVYTIQKWLTTSKILNIRFFAQYYIKELNGSYYINKISGFNPQKSNEPTTIEVIRISDKTPTPNFGVTNYFTDNDENFTDGLGNFFY
jgi:hypothetical protein